jgi:hypothetical protein
VLRPLPVLPAPVCADAILVAPRDAGDLLHPSNRARLLSYKRARSLALGPCMRLQFENRVTIADHVRRIARAERIADPAALAREFDAMAPLLPDGTSWRATLLLELPDALERRRELPLLNDAAHQLYIDLPRHSRIRAEANEDQPDRHRARLSAVHFLRFGFDESQRRALLHGAAVMLGCEHPNHAWRRLVPSHTLALLRADLAPVDP